MFPSSWLPMYFNTITQFNRIHLVVPSEGIQNHIKWSNTTVFLFKAACFSIMSNNIRLKNTVIKKAGVQNFITHVTKNMGFLVCEA
jgi:hypothetical protein